MNNHRTLAYLEALKIQARNAAKNNGANVFSTVFDSRRGNYCTNISRRTIINNALNSIRHQFLIPAYAPALLMHNSLVASFMSRIHKYSSRGIAFDNKPVVAPTVSRELPTQTPSNTEPRCHRRSNACHWCRLRHKRSSIM